MHSHSRSTTCPYSSGSLVVRRAAQEQQSDGVTNSAVVHGPRSSVVYLPAMYLHRNSTPAMSATSSLVMNARRSRQVISTDKPMRIDPESKHAER
jgi:hypothetical protein